VASWQLWPPSTRHTLPVTRVAPLGWLLQLESIQSRLFDVGSAVATPRPTSSDHKLQVGRALAVPLHLPACLLACLPFAMLCGCVTCSLMRQLCLGRRH
jgi:hypothetical protein